MKGCANKRYHEVTEIGNFYMASVMDVHVDPFAGINLGKANTEKNFQLLPTCHHLDKPWILCYNSNVTLLQQVISHSAL